MVLALRATQFILALFRLSSLEATTVRNSSSVLVVPSTKTLHKVLRHLFLPHVTQLWMEFKAHISSIVPKSGPRNWPATTRSLKSSGTFRSNSLVSNINTFHASTSEVFELISSDSSIFQLHPKPQSPINIVYMRSLKYNSTFVLREHMEYNPQIGYSPFCRYFVAHICFHWILYIVIWWWLFSKGSEIGYLTSFLWWGNKWRTQDGEIVASFLSAAGLCVCELSGCDYGLAPRPDLVIPPTKYPYRSDFLFGLVMQTRMVS